MCPFVWKKEKMFGAALESFFLIDGMADM